MANRSTKKSLERFKYEVADELGVPLSNGYNGDLTAKQNGSVGGYMVKKMIEAQERQMAGKGENIQKKKAGLCHGDLLFLLPESTNSFLKAVLPETASFSFAECDVRVLSVPGLPQELFLLLPKPPAAPPHPGKYPPAQIPDLHSAGYRKNLPVRVISNPHSQ